MLLQKQSEQFFEVKEQKLASKNVYLFLHFNLCTSEHKINIGF